MINVRIAAVLAVALVAVACKSAPKPVAEKKLPFLVAMIPIHEPEGGLGGEDSDAKGGTEMRFDPGMPVLSQAVADALERDTFTTVELLEGEQILSLPETEREKAWIAMADKLEADLILECSVEMSRLVKQKKNGNQWFNYPLFLLGGPFTWFVPDNTYYVEVELFGTFYDRLAIPRPRPGEEHDLVLGGRPEGRVTQANNRFDSVDVNFIKRADDGWDYAVSIVVPSTFLAKQNDDFQELLVETVVKQVATGFARSVQLKRKQIVETPIAPFYLETDGFDIDRVDENHVFVRAVIFKPEGPAKMSRLSIAAGGEPVDYEPPPPSKVQREDWKGFRYVFETTVEIVPGATELSFDIEAEDRDKILRTYTFAIPGADS